MKKSNLLQWLVAAILVCVTAYSMVTMHHIRQVNSVKLHEQSLKDARQAAKQKQLLADQKKRIRPAAWNQATLSGGYPDISKYVHAKTLENKVWIEVNIRKQRVYIRRGPYTIYTMYASVAKNYKKTKRYNQTPVGKYHLSKNRGTSYYDATRGYGAKYWTALKGYGSLYRFESVPFDANGHVLKKQAARLGGKVTKKNNIKAYGTIRLSVPDAQWIEENLPAKTPVMIMGHKDKRDPWRVLSLE
ncbi:L,D-transpeptidase catalytic domain [Ligilactobacillus sp. WC1T17]|uniref:L,D-transpeptidase catalytic domain n=1 Tax=Ligilactobacillus ruminis TaxID=1623 RepID=A0ABY1AB67_9LACO|nr:L,D-transpeptidase catalytic domain [Ligilactobacillus ruminis]